MPRLCYSAGKADYATLKATAPIGAVAFSEDIDSLDYEKLFCQKPIILKNHENPLTRHDFIILCELESHDILQSING